MAMAYADLHLHSIFSDGADAPAAVVARAAALGISAAALTDHDTTEGTAAFAAAAKDAGIETLSGVEVSACFEGREVHVLGLGAAPDAEGLCRVLTRLRAGRWERVEGIIRKLKELGITLNAQDVAAQSTVGAAGRMHIANALKARGTVSATQEAFDRYLNFGRPAYVRKTLVPAAEAVGVIHGAGGLALVAHPGLGKTLRKTLPRLLELPFDGIEAYHISHSPERTAALLALAKDRGLAVSGGSDCHGTIKGRHPEMGKVRVPYAVFETLCARLAGRR